MGSSEDAGSMGKGFAVAPLVAPSVWKFPSSRPRANFTTSRLAGRVSNQGGIGGTMMGHNADDPTDRLIDLVSRVLVTDAKAKGAA